APAAVVDWSSTGRSSTVCAKIVGSGGILPLTTTVHLGRPSTEQWSRTSRVQVFNTNTKQNGAKNCPLPILWRTIAKVRQKQCLHSMNFLSIMEFQWRT